MRLRSQLNVCHGRTGSVGDAVHHGSFGLLEGQISLYEHSISILGYISGRIDTTYQHAQHSLHFGAFWRDCQVPGIYPPSRTVDHCPCGRSVSISKTHSSKFPNFPTFGRKDGCSSITELFLNFCTRQSLPCIAANDCQHIAETTGIIPTGIRHLCNFVTVIAVPRCCQLNPRPSVHDCYSDQRCPARALTNLS